MLITCTYSLFWGQIFELETVVLTCFEASEFENPIFSSWSVCMCYQPNSKTNYSRNYKFGIQHLYSMLLLETFYKNRTNHLCMGAHKRFLMPMTGIS